MNSVGHEIAIEQPQNSAKLLSEYIQQYTMWHELKNSITQYYCLKDGYVR